MEIKLFTDFYSRGIVKDDNKSLYIFTDNWNRSSGSGIINSKGWYSQKYAKRKEILNFPRVTQAVIRGLDNAFPISTMVNQYKVQITDTLYDKFVKIFDDELEEIYSNAHKFKTMYYCPNLGHGKISDMPKFAPECYNYMIQEFDKMKAELTKKWI